jgi:hypothetical protein
MSRRHSVPGSNSRAPDPAIRKSPMTRDASFEALSIGAVASTPAS